MITDKYEYTIAIINSLLIRIKYNEKDAIDTYSTYYTIYVNNIYIPIL